MTQHDPVREWLLEGDPAIRWQTLRDLCRAPAREIQRARDAVTTEGWGARLLALQDPEHTWGGGLYNPKWTSTTYTLLLLRDFGMAPNAATESAAALLLEHGMRSDGGAGFGPSPRSETCITGMILALATSFQPNDPRADTLAEHLLAQQMDDGGWNCRRPRGATHSSVHTTITALEALTAYADSRPRRARRASAVHAATKRGREFLLAHRLFRSHRTGNIIHPEFQRLHYPPRWHYDILRALDHFRAVDAPRDERLHEAVDIVCGHRGDDGRWPLHKKYSGKEHFALERLGAPSRWITLKALRVLGWWGRGS